MLINVRTLGLNMSDALRRHFERSLTLALRPFGVAVSEVTARLSDINAGRGGDDKRCKLVAVLPRQGVVVVDGLHADAYASIDQAASRLRRAVSHALSRHRRRHKQSRQFPSPQSPTHDPS